MMYNGIVRYSALLIAMLSAPVQAQMTPGPEHYEAAANQILLARAAAHIRALELRSVEESLALAAARRRAEEARRLRGRLVDLWGAHIRRLSGAQAMPKPGDGWIEVHRGN